MLRRTLNPTSFLFLSLGLAHCGRPIASSLDAAATRADSIVVIGLGGYNSCPRGDVWSASHLAKIQSIEDTVQAKGRGFYKIVSCFDMSQKLHYLLPGSKKPRTSASVDEFTTEVSASLEGFPRAQLNVIGHSYGGWTAMKLITDKSLAGLRVQHLVTVDPISYRFCKPAAAVGATVMKWVYPESKSGACQQFPVDTNIWGVKAKANDWVNYYQNEFVGLHSDQVEAADQNYLKNYGGDYRILSHQHMWSDGTVWRAFAGKITDSL